MFKKDVSVVFKGEKKYGGKDIKQFMTLVEEKFGDSTSISKKTLLSLKSGPLTTGFFANGDGEILYAANDTREKTLQKEIFPSLLTLWRHTAQDIMDGNPVSSLTDSTTLATKITNSYLRDVHENLGSSVGILKLPRVVINSPVVPFLLSGADIFAPGLTSQATVGGSVGVPINQQLKNVQVGSLVAVFVDHNPFAVAVGIWKGNLTEGTAVQILHAFGDHLWKTFPEGWRLPPGFMAGSVRGFGANTGHHEASDEESDIDEGAKEETESKGENAGGKDGNGESDADDHDESTTPTSKTKSGKNGGSPTGKKVVQEFSPPSRKKERDPSPSESPRTDEIFSPSPCKDEMDKLMFECFCRGSKLLSQTAVGKSPFPMDLNTFYATHLRPARPAGTSVDVKLSSYKKLKRFFDKLVDRHLIDLNKDGTKIVKIYFNKPEIKDCSLETAGTTGIVPGGMSSAAGLLSANSAGSSLPLLALSSQAANLGPNVYSLLSNQTICGLFTANTRGTVYEELSKIDKKILDCLISPSNGSVSDAKYEKILIRDPKSGQGYVRNATDFREVLRLYASDKDLFTSKKLVNISNCPPEFLKAFDAASGAGNNSHHSVSAKQAPKAPKQVAFDYNAMDFPELGGGSDDETSKPAITSAIAPSQPSNTNTEAVNRSVNRTVTLDNLTKLLFGSNQVMKKTHRIVSISLMNELAIRHKEGAAPQVRVRTEKRMNHNCTLVQQLQRYEFDLNKVADYLKTKLSVNVQVIGEKTLNEKNEVKDLRELLVQGFFDKDLCRIFVEDFRIPKDAVLNNAENRKADMKQKSGSHTKGRQNVVKA